MKEIDVTVFGDSIAKGLVLKNGKPAALETNAVSLIAQHFNIVINNKSTFGQTIHRLREKGTVDEYLKKINRRKRNIVAFCVGGNDCDFDWRAIDKTPTEEHFCKTPIDVFTDDYMTLINKLKKKKVEVYICAMPVVCSKKFFDQYVCALANRENILTFLEHDTSKISRHQELYNNRLREVARELKVTFLDIRTPFLEVKNIEKLYHDDGLHPNQTGHELIAETIIKHFEKKA